jgi:hypothetical protein
LDPIDGNPGPIPPNGGDSDGDTIPDASECPSLPCPDSDGDGIPNYMDPDDDNDGVLTQNEDPNGAGGPADDNTDGDALPNYLDPDDDGDGTPSSAEGNDPNNNDDDEDAIDTDGDGIVDYLDPIDGNPGPIPPNGGDSDGDTIPDATECPSLPCQDSDGDGIPNYADPDDDNDGVLTKNEDINGGGPTNDDTDGDGLPNYLDPDDDGDGIPSSAEGNDPNNNDDDEDASDGDGDGIPSYLDKDESTTDGDGNDSDNDTIPDNVECPSFSTGCPDTDNDGAPDYMEGNPGKLLAIKAILHGAYSSSTGMMRDDLRVAGIIPTSDPYPALGYVHKGNGAAFSTLNASVFATTGADAIVDWVFVELRNPNTTAVATRSALIQRDGDVVALDGVSALNFSEVTGAQYFVVVRHRNHLGVMTANVVTLSATPTPVDFTTGVGVHGVNPQMMLGGKHMLWSGNANGNKQVIQAGPGNDTNSVLIRVLGHPGNANVNANFIVTGYSSTDVNMDGRTIAAGPGNEINLILINVFTHPGNTTLAANYIIQEQVP